MSKPRTAPRPTVRTPRRTTGPGESTGKPTHYLTNTTHQTLFDPRGDDDLGRTPTIYHHPPTEYPVLISLPLGDLEQSFSEGYKWYFWCRVREGTIVHRLASEAL